MTSAGAMAAVLILVASLGSSCETASSPGTNPLYNSNSTPTAELSPRPIIDWMELLYYHIANEKLSPPVASRIYGYTGVLVYESVIGGMPEYQTLVGQVNGLEELPRPDLNAEYDWLTVMNESLYLGINYLLERAITGDIVTIDNMRAAQLEDRKAAGVSEEVIMRSKAYARDLAYAVEEWAKTDGFDATRLDTKTYKERVRDVEKNPEYWIPTDFGQTPLEPLWGGLRGFTLEGELLCRIEYGDLGKGTVPTTLPEFSTEPGSDFYKTVEAVYEKDQNLTEEERIIALFWADDPGETSTPPGHWIYIMNNMVKSKNMDLANAAEMYALTCMAIADAFIVVWDTKYQVYLVRPKTYIREFMGDPTWEPYVETPPFPEYASGHSGVSGAAATVLDSLLGKQPFVDSTHLIIGLDPRSFESFWDAAYEAAESRHYGGIHYRAAIEDALEQGKCVAGQTFSRVQTRLK